MDPSAYADRFTDAGATESGADANLINVDANLKCMEWTVDVECFNQAIARDGGDPRGFYVQNGDYFIPTRIEFAARFGYTNCD